jgi:hypothetical protein
MIPPLYPRSVLVDHDSLLSAPPPLPNLPSGLELAHELLDLASNSSYPHPVPHHYYPTNVIATVLPNMETCYKYTALY